MASNVVALIGADIVTGRVIVIANIIRAYEQLKDVLDFSVFFPSKDLLIRRSEYLHIIFSSERIIYMFTSMGIAFALY